MDSTKLCRPAALAAGSRWMILIAVSLLAGAAFAQSGPGSRAGETAPPTVTAPSGEGWLGVQIQPLDEGLREAFDFRKPGVLVGQVSPGSPAERAGLKRGDILISVDGVKIATPEALTEEIRKHPPGDSVAIGRVRDGREERVKVLLEAAPVRTPHPPRSGPGEFSFDGAYLGARIEALGPDLASYFALAPDRGVLVTAITPDSPAERAGIKAGDVIVGMSGDPIATPPALLQWIDARKPGDQVTVKVIRHGKPLELKATLAQAPMADRMRRVMRLAPQHADPIIDDLRQRLESLERKFDELTKDRK
jgi:C-terminal processing protease CtpA/Prc